MFGNFVAVITMYTLVWTDVKLALAVPENFDLWLDILSILCLCVLSVDICIQTVYKPSYMLSFYFYVDIISTISLGFNISLITGDYSYPMIVKVILLGGKQLRIIRVVRLIQLSTTFRRLVQWLFGSSSSPVTPNTDSSAHDDDEQIQWDIDHVKLEPKLKDVIGDPLIRRRNQNKRISNPSRKISRQSTTSLTTQNSDSVSHETQLETSSESKVGRQMSEVNTRKIGILVIICSSFAPLVASKDDNVPVNMLELKNLAIAYSNPRVFSRELASMIESLNDSYASVTRIGWIGLPADSPYFLPGGGTHNLNTRNSFYTLTPFEADQVENHWTLSGCNNTWAESIGNIQYVSLIPDHGNECPSSRIRRRFEVSIWSTKIDENNMKSDLVLILDERERIQWDGIFAIIQIFFTILVMLIMSGVFESDCNHLILVPISRLVSTMRQIQSDPLCANFLIDVEMNREIEYKDAKARYLAVRVPLRWFRKKPSILITDSYREYETSDSAKLEKTILKLGSLLVVGFGEAGAKIVGSSIKDAQSIGVRPGRIIDGVFGYITIEDFGIVTEVLQDGIVVLVNRLAEIVHGIIDEYNGFTCRNTGSGFLVLWTLPTGEEEQERMCDLALIALCDIMVAINKSPILATYSEHPHLLMRLPGYKVRVHAAAHRGRAIEGAVGSELKLDASFLGPDVVLAQSLADLGNREYKCAILLSGSFVHALSKQLEQLCRSIDMISMGSDAEFELFTIDLDQSAVRTAPLKQDESLKHIENIQLREYMIKQARVHRKIEKLKLEEYHPFDHFAYTDLELVRKKFHSKNGQLFHQLFSKSLLNYLCGEWDVAKRSFRQCLIFWLTHTSESRRKHFDDDPAAPARRARALHAIQTSDDMSLARLGFNADLVDGPSISIFRFIVSAEQQLLSRANGTALSELIQREWRGYRSF